MDSDFRNIDVTSFVDFKVRPGKGRPKRLTFLRGVNL
jgi:hypothetical protein